MIAMTGSEAASDLPAMVEPSAPSTETAEDIALRKLAAAGEKMVGVGAPEAALERTGLALSEPVPQDVESSGVEALGSCGCNDRKSFVFAIGTIGYDFGTEARRDSFRQLMPITNDRPANPYATEQMVHYLGTNAAEATKLIWTFNLELTPIYAVEAELPYAREVYDFLRRALGGQIQKEDSPEYISRVSVSGALSGRTVRLYSGQVVPIVVVQHRGLWSWNVKTLIDAVLARFDARTRDRVRVSLENFLNRVYYELRNLGQTSPDRALNFAATNAFQATDAISRALSPRELVGSTGLYMLADISVVKSPFCRMDSDCWDVKLTFFDPENDRRARTVLRFTIDVSDELPVTMGPIRSWAEASH